MVLQVGGARGNSLAQASVMGAVLAEVASVLRACEGAGLLRTLASRTMATTLPALLCQLSLIARSSLAAVQRAMQSVLALLSTVRSVAELSPVDVAAGSAAPSDEYGEVVVVESEHPYRPGTRAVQSVQFSSDVVWLAVDLDPRTGFVFPSDALIIRVPMAPGEPDRVVYQVSGGAAPQTRSLLVPGNRALFELATGSALGVAPGPNTFGFLARVTGYRNPSTHGVDALVRAVNLFAGECISTIGMAAGSGVSDRPETIAALLSLQVSRPVHPRLQTASIRQHGHARTHLCCLSMEYI